MKQENAVEEAVSPHERLAELSKKMDKCYADAGTMQADAERFREKIESKIGKDVRGEAPYSDDAYEADNARLESMRSSVEKLTRSRGVFDEQIAACEKECAKVELETARGKLVEIRRRSLRSFLELVELRQEMWTRVFEIDEQSREHSNVFHKEFLPAYRLVHDVPPTRKRIEENEVLERNERPPIHAIGNLKIELGRDIMPAALENVPPVMPGLIDEATAEIAALAEEGGTAERAA